MYFARRSTKLNYRQIERARALPLLAAILVSIPTRLQYCDWTSVEKLNKSAQTERT